MNDQTKELLMKLQKRLDLVMVGALFLLMCVAGYLFINEQGSVLPDPDPPVPAQWEVKLPSEPSKKIAAAYVDTNPKPDESEDVRKAVRNNMFDFKSAREAAVAAKELNQQYNQAEGLFGAKKFSEALKIVESILARDKNHANANDLKKRIEAQLNPPKPGATPAPPA